MHTTSFVAAAKQILNIIFMLDDLEILFFLNLIFSHNKKNSKKKRYLSKLCF